MIRCAVPFRSRPTTWLATITSEYATRYFSDVRQNSLSNPTTSAPVSSTSANVAVGDPVEDGAVTVDASKNGGEMIAGPYSPRVLPTSPFLDAKFIDAKQKHKISKLPPSRTPTLFQRQLAKNPYAQALVTPIRQCQVTDIRLPGFFLQDFEVMAHPETREPWWVPTSLRRKSKFLDVKPGESKVASSLPEHDSQLEADRVEEDFLTTKPRSPKVRSSPPQPISLGPKTYTLSRHDLLSAMQNAKSGWRMPPWKYFTTGSTLNSAVARRVISHTSWRKDMDGFVLELMRRRVVEDLRYLAQLRRGYVAGCVDWEDAKIAGRQPGVILWVGKDTGEVGDGLLNTEELLDIEAKVVVDEQELAKESLDPDGPPTYATLTIGKGNPYMVPVHNLPVLLGPKHIEDLRRQSPIFGKELVIIRDKNATVAIQMKLWKLQGYLAFPEGINSKPNANRR